MPGQVFLPGLVFLPVLRVIIPEVPARTAAMDRMVAASGPAIIASSRGSAARIPKNSRFFALLLMTDLIITAIMANSCRSRIQPQARPAIGPSAPGQTCQRADAGRWREKILKKPPAPQCNFPSAAKPESTPPLDTPLPARSVEHRRWLGPLRSGVRHGRIYPPSRNTSCHLITLAFGSNS